MATEKRVLPEHDDDDVKKRTRLECDNISNCHFSLSFVGYANNEIVSVMNNDTFLNPLVIQLIDLDCKPLRVPRVRIDFIYSSKLQFHPTLAGILSNKDGQVIFGAKTISIRPQLAVTNCPVEMCSNGCYGLFVITARAFHLGNIVTGQKLQLHMKINPNAPNRLHVRCNNVRNYSAGSVLEEFSVAAFSDNNILQETTPAQFTMKVWPIDRSVSTANCFRILDTDVPIKGYFSFGKRLAPKKCGQYYIQFIYRRAGYSIDSEILTIDVLPDVPTKLIALPPITTPAVTNSNDIRSRVIFEQLKLLLLDIHDNVVGTSVKAELSVSLSSRDNLPETPTFDGSCLTSMRVPFVNGEVLFPSIVLDENCPGVDGQEYLLNFEAAIENLPIKKSLSCQIPFVFYQSMNKLELMTKLTKERDALQTSIKAYHELFEITRELISALQDNVKQLVAEEQNSRSKLRECGIHEKSLGSLSQVGIILQEKLSERAKIWKSYRRCSPPPLANDAQLVGKIGHLACVANQNIAKILSWHLAEKMECFVTYTMEKAVEINHKAEGMQQVLSLDLFNHNDALNVWNRPLPHTEFPGHFQPTGYPVPIRDQLILPEDADTCKVASAVFGFLLGETILIDTLEDGLVYRREIVKHRSCPTILTRDGQRIQRDGSFGGPKNKYRSADNNANGLIFGTPLPDKERKLVQVIDLLKSHQSIAEQLAAANEDLEKYQQQNASKDATRKSEECRQMECRLKKIVSQIESLSRKSIVTDHVSSNSRTTLELTPIIIKQEICTEVLESNMD